MLSVNRKGLSRRLVAVSHLVTWRLGMWFPKAIPLVYVVGYPKSGTTWACQLTAAYLQLPFPKSSILPVGFPAVVHGHELLDDKYPHSVYVMRDGRDVMVSMYYHIQRILKGGEQRWLPADQRSIYLDADDPQTVRQNFPRFLETQINRTLGCRCSWGEHVNSYLDRDHSKVPCLKYEELLSDGLQALSSEMPKLDGKEPSSERIEFILNDFSFSRRSGRKPNSEDKSKFLRKGIAGDWKNHFTREAGEVFDRHCGDALIAAGYEPDRRWLEDLPTS